MMTGMAHMSFLLIDNRKFHMIDPIINFTDINT